MAQNLANFIEKSPTEILDRIEEEMQDAAKKEEFERAGRLRDQLSAINKAFESTDRFLNENINADVLAIHEDITHAALSQFTIKAGRITGSRSWIIDRANLLEDEEIITAMIGKIYSESIPPQELIIDQLPEDISSIEGWLSEKAGKSVSLTRPVKGEKLEIIQLVKRNANQALIQYLSKRANDSAVSGGALTEIAEQLELAELPLRIECFDISNIQGTSMVASMVVFEDGQPKKSEYRRFSIDDQSGFDDTRAMNHVITRRFKRYLEEKSIDIAENNTQGVSRPKFAYPPQLVVVDGGKPQVNAAAKALRDLGIEDIALCGLAKRLEEVWLPNSSEPVIFPRHSEALYLLQRVRDEAHRFAINFHRSKRSKLMLDSFLDEIGGLGEGRRKALLDKFGTVTALKSASIEEISDVPGIGPKMAKTIFESINQKEPTRNIDMQTGEILDA
ncbi:unannotated protein [freshwater metagenome]|uniref:Unannotated protein n=1 Tax=freshwater metagenome TaxID=449393 RepID=A0A6J6V970_9ZZZZ